AQPATLAQERELAAAMAAARRDEYRSVIEQATAAGSANDAERLRTVRRLRDELRRIHRRDYFPATERDTAREAVEALAGPRTKADAPEMMP
ncbi:MAG TPA: hypothetical protein VN888_10310, partial [Mycobacterium sp.]|nr:hypothetical protein [Mycobacterium sp.]